ncbi:hypothetical protein [Sabulibacter ruber]|uniref:hypothetical protein n=1 Tax=Sabulibacter ruber TaxID=2811901 RepID=UPI001A964F3E|nr:hypothetical protein [Sabulibacter ruber]
MQRNKGEDIKVTDQQYNALVRQREELREEVVKWLARDSSRNDYIVEEYLTGRHD